MQLRFTKKFLKQLADLPGEIRAGIEEFVFVELPQCRSLADAGNQALFGNQALQARGLAVPREAGASWTAFPI